MEIHSRYNLNEGHYSAILTENFSEQRAYELDRLKKLDNHKRFDLSQCKKTLSTHRNALPLFGKFSMIQTILSFKKKVCNRISISHTI